MPAQPKVRWRSPLTGQGLGGVAATDRYVFVVDRDGPDRFDIFRCLDAETGAERWNVRGLAQGNLDYGNSARATPLVHNGRVYFFNAFGRLSCIDVESGETLWIKELRQEFEVDDDTAWGTCSSPLIHDGKLIVNPGGRAGSVVALNPETGGVLWQSPGDLPSYSSFIVATLGGREQLVGYDRNSMGGWDPDSGKRLWRLVPPQAHDFNVPTPIIAPGGERLIFATENNGTRLHRFDTQGEIIPKPVAENPDLAPDSHTPVVVNVLLESKEAGGERHFLKLYGVWGRLYCLDLRTGNELRALWTKDDPAFSNYVSMIASRDRLLIIPVTGELILVDTTADQFRVVSRVSLFKDEEGVLSHPALVGTRLYVRGSEELLCVDLNAR